MANVIFDFDGTIADSLPVVITIFEELLRGGKPMPAAEVERLRGMSLLRVGAELKIVPWRVPFLLARGRARMRRRLDEIPMFDGMDAVIRRLNAEGHKLYVVSSNSARTIRVFLESHNLDNQFIRVYGRAGLFGKTKLLRLMLRRNRLDTDETYYIGDESRDVEAAHRNHVRAIAVTWGYNNNKLLKAHKPEFMAGKPADILAAVNKRA
jgi:phosphoglycolate phosphatase-like HAD superfamily hydrolase